MECNGSFFGGFFAEGGEPPIGKWSVVGEEGPELIKPQSAMTVIPNGAPMGGGASVNVTNNFDFSSANPATIQLLRSTANQIIDQSVNATMQAIEQGGSAARAVGRRA